MDYRLVFICMGNICRSPTAHGVMRHKLREAGLAHRVMVDSAGTLDHHHGSAPDERAQAHARARGYELAGIRAKGLKRLDLRQADLLLVMDDDNEREVLRQLPAALHGRVRHLTDFCRYFRADEVPDPYAADAAAFEHVLDLVEDACEGLLQHLRRELARRGEGPGSAA